MVRAPVRAAGSGRVKASVNRLGLRVRTPAAPVPVPEGERAARLAFDDAGACDAALSADVKAQRVG